MSPAPTWTTSSVACSPSTACARPAARRLAPFVIGLGNLGQTVPSLGVIVLFAILFAPGFRGAVVALVVYAFLPILRNTIVGLQQIDPFVVESARGMGMS